MSVRGIPVHVVNRTNGHAWFKKINEMNGMFGEAGKYLNAEKLPTQEKNYPEPTFMDELLDEDGEVVEESEFEKRDRYDRTKALREQKARDWAKFQENQQILFPYLISCIDVSIENDVKSNDKEFAEIVNKNDFVQLLARIRKACGMAHLEGATEAFDKLGSLKQSKYPWFGDFLSEWNRLIKICKDADQDTTVKMPRVAIS